MHHTAEGMIEVRTSSRFFSRSGFVSDRSGRECCLGVFSPIVAFSANCMVFTRLCSSARGGEVFVRFGVPSIHLPVDPEVDLASSFSSGENSSRGNMGCSSMLQTPS